MITLASESQALRRGAAEHLEEAAGSATPPDGPGAGGYADDRRNASRWSPVPRAGRARRSSSGCRDGVRVAACDCWPTN